MKEDKFKTRNKIGYMEAQEVLRIDDIKGLEYMWDGTELYRLTPLKGRFGRKKLSPLTKER